MLNEITDLTYDIPKQFYRKDNYDLYNRALYNTYIKMVDGTYKKTRLALVKNGCIFKLYNPLTKEESVEYRAYKNAMYSKKEQRVVVFATTLEEYNKENNLPEYEFIPPTDEICRKG